MSTTGEKRHMDRVARLPCAVCGAQPVEVHHALEGRTPGRRSGNYLTIPLCTDCHRGPHGIHGDRSMWNVMRKTEIGCLNATLEALYGDI